MNSSVSTPPDWDVLETLYRDLRVVEKLKPGSPQARNIEAAIDLLLENRITSSSPRFLARDAVRRARFLHRRADEQHAAAAARLRPGHSIATTPAPAAPDRDDPDETADDTTDPFVVDPLKIEDVVCAEDLARRIGIASATAATSGRPVLAVLNGLRRDLSTASIAGELGISASTVQRTITDIRLQARTILTLAAA